MTVNFFASLILVSNWNGDDLHWSGLSQNLLEFVREYYESELNIKSQEREILLLKTR